MDKKKSEPDLITARTRRFEALTSPKGVEQLEVKGGCCVTAKTNDKKAPLIHKVYHVQALARVPRPPPLSQKIKF